MSFESVEKLYSTTKLEVDQTVQDMFGLVNGIMVDFFPVIMSVAVVYIMLMGYALVSGHIVLNGKEAAIRFSKVVLIIVLTKLFMGYFGDLYNLFWDVPESIGDYLANSFETRESSNESFLSGMDFETIMGLHSANASHLGQKYAGEHADQEALAIGVWSIAMAPVFVINIALMLARVISAVLFLIAPVVFILSLMGFQNNYLMAWIKAILLTFLTVIIVYIVGVFALDIVSDQLVALRNLPYDPNSPVSIVEFAPLGVLSVFAVVIISQATTIASSIIGVTPINTQQATGFLQIAALQGAGKIPK